MFAIASIGRFIERYTGFSLPAVPQGHQRLENFRRELEKFLSPLSSAACPDRNRISVGCVRFFNCAREILILCSKNEDLMHLLLSESSLAHHAHFLEYFPDLHAEVRAIWEHPWNNCASLDIEPTGEFICPSMVLPTFEGSRGAITCSLVQWNRFPLCGEDKKFFDDTVSEMYMVKAQYLRHLVRSLLQ